MLSKDFHYNTIDIFSQDNSVEENKIKCDLVGINYFRAHEYYKKCGELIESVKKNYCHIREWDLNHRSDDYFSISIKYESYINSVQAPSYCNGIYSFPTYYPERIETGCAEIPYYLISEELISVLVPYTRLWVWVEGKIDEETKKIIKNSIAMIDGMISKISKPQ